MSKFTQSHRYDISPTTPLSGLHLNGVVTRRFLFSYPVPPEALSRFLPPNAELSVWQGFAWVSACFVNLKRLRPSLLPGPVWIEFNYLIHRTRARLPYPDGVLRESVLVLEANINSRLFAAIGKRLPGVRFQARDIQLLETPDYWRVQMQDEAGTLLYQADVVKNSIGAGLPASSRFPDIEAADAFLLNVSYGADWNAQTQNLRLLAETHDVWHTPLTGSCKTHRYAFLESLDAPATEADHVITMTNIPHYFALRGIEQRPGSGN